MKMCKHSACENGLTDMELMEQLEELDYDFRNNNLTADDVEKDSRSIHKLSRDDFDWSGAYEAAINEGFAYCESCKKWYKK